MITSNELAKIDLEKLQGQLKQYQEEWVAISLGNKIVAHGHTYRDAVKGVKDPAKVVLFKVPNLRYSLAPIQYAVQISEVSHWESRPQ